MSKCSNRKDLAASPAMQGVKEWRTLNELAQTDQFANLLHDEFPHAASEWPKGQSRRDFLKLMSASLALAGLSGCTRKADERLVPYVKQPEWMVPGKPLYFATAVTLGGYAKGVLVESYDGRPIKIEGNPDHPASPKRVSAATAYGASDAMTQGEVLNLYDPNRSANVLNIGSVSDYNGFTKTIADNLASHPDGQGIRLLTEGITSPTLVDQISRFLKKYPNARWHTFEPLSRENCRRGIEMAFGRPLEAIHSLDKAKAIVSLDENFLADGPTNLVYAAQFTDGRRVRADWAAAKRAMNRLFVAETSPMITAAMADVRCRVRPSELDKLAIALVDAVAGKTTSDLTDKQASWIKAAAVALNENRGASAVLISETASAAAHAAIHRLNADLGNIGKTVRYIDPVIVAPAGDASLASLVKDMNAGSVKTLLIVGGNPVYSAPADFEFASAMSKVDFRVHLSQHYDETGFYCHWHLPMSHELEGWSDARAFDGTATVIQPLILPLHATRNAIELFSTLLGEFDRDAHQVVQDYWRKSHGNDADFDAFWQKSLNDGVIAGTAFPIQDVAPVARADSAAVASAAAEYDIVFRADPCIYDGRFATNGWLQELPNPITKLTWDNAALMSAATAAKLNVENEKRVKISVGSRSVTAPVYVVPGHSDSTITVNLGYGRTKAWKIGDSEEDLLACGFSGYAIRTSTAMWWTVATSVEKIDGHYRLASTQEHQLMEHREPIRVRHVEDAATADADAAQLGRLRGQSPTGTRSIPLSLYKDFDYDAEPNKWGMVIDQNACIGCNACMIACQAENNSPVVGKDQVQLGRHMHWIRIDAYYAGDTEADAAGPFFQPLPCQQCEKAPCEVVCPVNATIHDNEGLNLQVYNRCVGTRYCANNCPYKVRRFNFLQYTDRTDELLMLQRNPEVTVRSRGIMEKCTYCIQRISHARIESKKQSRPILDGEVLTACQQACPTSAIVFGNLNDQASQVSQLMQEPALYSLLEELQTVPRTTYLPRYSNELPGMEPFESTVMQQEEEEKG
jgi:MoCo/4Fe-4S cofactor protein with predicted Tat translocation signal